MTYTIICFLCIAVLAAIVVLLRLGVISFNVKPLAFIIGIGALILFYKAQSDGEIHVLSVRIAEMIVGAVQWVLGFVR